MLERAVSGRLGAFRSAERTQQRLAKRAMERWLADREKCQEREEPLVVSLHSTLRSHSDQNTHQTTHCRE